MTEVVYFVRAGSGGPIKIGFTKNLSTRLAALTTSSPDEVSLMGAVAGGREYEAELHEKFSDLRTNGEWFAPASELLEFIESLLAARSIHFDALQERNEPDDYSNRAAKWAAYTEDYYSRSLRRSVSAARKYLAQKIGVSGGLLENLRRGRIVSITARDFEQIRRAYIAALESEVNELRDLLKFAETEKELAAQAQVDAARKILNGK